VTVREAVKYLRTAQRRAILAAHGATKGPAAQGAR
jgi:hypothetical protein